MTMQTDDPGMFEFGEYVTCPCDCGHTGQIAGWRDYRDGEGRYPVTLEVIYGQAWAGSTLSGVALNDGEAGFPVSRLRRRR